MRASHLEVIGLDWDHFSTWFGEKWKPGEHASIIAPTGVGKTTLAAALLELRRWVLVGDPKGGDDTLAGMHLRRLTQWPGEKRMTKLLEDDQKNRRPSRFVVGPEVQREEDWPKITTAIRDSLKGAFNMGGWTYYLDELQIATDRRMMNLQGEVARWLVSARSRGLTLVSSFQAPRMVPLEALQQPSWIMASHTRDRTVVDRTAEVLGRPKAEIRGLMSEIDRYHWLIVGRDPRDPVVVTSPPKRS